MKTSNALLMILIPTALALSACHVQDAVAPKALLEPTVAMRNFPIEDKIELRDNTWFLWKAGVSREDQAKNVAAVLKFSHIQDKFEEEANKLNAEKDALRKKFSEKQVDIDELKKALEENPKQIEGLSKTIAGYQAVVDQTSEDLKKATDAGNATEMKKLQAKIDKYKAKILERGADLEKLQRHAQELADTRESIGGEKALKRWDEIDEELLANDKKTQSEKNKIMGAFEDFAPQPKSVTVAREANGELSVAIEGWDPNDGGNVRTLSTDDGTITNVKYTSLGGTLEFSVKLLTGEAQLKMSRTRYDSPDGKIRFKGDIQLWPDSSRVGKPLREGSVKSQTK